jgi:hypothetical protein
LREKLGFDPRAARGSLSSSLLSRAKIVSLPVSNQLLDRFAVREIVRKNFPRKLRHLRVARESQGHELAHRKLRDATAQIRRQQTLQAQLHFQADDAVLDGKRENPRAKRQENQSDSDQQRNYSVCGKVTPYAENRRNKVYRENREHHEMKRRNKFYVIFETLSHRLGSEEWLGESQAGF